MKEEDNDSVRWVLFVLKSVHNVTDEISLKGCD